MANNREISQFAGLVTVNDTTDAVSIGASVNVGTGITFDAGNNSITVMGPIEVGNRVFTSDTNYGARVQINDGADSQYGGFYAQNNGANSNAASNFALFEGRDGNNVTFDVRANGNITLNENNVGAAATATGGSYRQNVVGVSSYQVDSTTNTTTGAQTVTTLGHYIYATGADGGYSTAAGAQEYSYAVARWQRNGTINNGFITADQLAIWSLGRYGTVNNSDAYSKLNLSLRSIGDSYITMSFKADGTLKFPAGGGIDFSATSDSSGTATSEVLDDYEEGTFTPTIRGSGVDGSATYTSRGGFYTKVGNKVTVWGFMDINTVGSPTNTPWITDFPFAPSTSLNNQGIFGTVTSSGGIENFGYLRYGTSAGPYIYAQTNSGTGIVPISIISAGNYITFTATYFV